MLKISLLCKKLTNFTGNNSRILRIKNAKFREYCFYMKTNIKEDFQICISAPLIIAVLKATKNPLGIISTEVHLDLLLNEF